MIQNTLAVFKSGNSVGIRVPVSILRELGVKEGERVSFKFQGDNLILEKKKCIPEISWRSKYVVDDVNHPGGMDKFTEREEGGPTLRDLIERSDRGDFCAEIFVNINGAEHVITIDL